MPQQIPAAVRRPACAVLLGLIFFLAVNVYLLKFREAKPGAPISHPNLVFLQGPGGREVLLIGTVPVDLDEESSTLVKEALMAQKPEIVMLEGTPLAGMQALMASGRWEMRGMKKPSDVEWMHLDPDIPPVELRQRKKRGWFSGPAPLPQKSLVPVKVSFWAYHLTSAVGGNIAAAVSVAATQGIPVRFLGPKDNGILQGYMQVQAFAEQAATELLEEERRQGQLSGDAMNTALERAEKNIRQDQEKWLHDARGEANRVITKIKESRSEEEAGRAFGLMEELGEFLADGVSKTMQDFQRGALILSVDKLSYVQDKLEQAGYAYLSQSSR